MKGKLILVPVKEPKEGMKVVWNAGGSWKPETIREVKSYDIQFEHWTETWFHTTELQQIAIEYVVSKRSADSFDLTAYFSKETIPLSVEDYEKALPLIGQEVEWEGATEYGGWEEKHTGIPPRRARVNFPIKVAKLITPSPIVYTEQEAREIASMAWFNSILGKESFTNWWETHKKK